MLFHRAAAVYLSLLGLPAAADCTGVNYLDQLSPAQTATLDAAVADMP